MKAPEREPYNQMQFSAICRTLAGVGGLPLCRDAVGACYNLSQLGWNGFNNL